MTEWYWVFVAFIAPTMWAISNVIDVYFVHSVYKNPYDGAIISAVIQVLVWLIVPFGLIDLSLSLYAWPILILSGILFSFAILFYFKSLFLENDASFVQLLWNFSVPVTMFLSWLVFKEYLQPVQYLGCLIVLLGVTPITLKSPIKLSMIKKIVLLMSVAVALLSCSMILSSHAYESSRGSFIGAYLFFALGSFISGVILLIIRMVFGEPDSLIHLRKMSFQYLWIFLIAEGLGLVGTISSQKALAISPSPAFVATVESLIPVIIMFVSFFLALVMRHFRPQEQKWQIIYNNQVSGVTWKLISVVIISGGIYLLSQ